MTMRKLIFCAAMCAALNALFAQDVSQERLVRISLWAETDAYPGYFEGDAVSDKERRMNTVGANESQFALPVRKIKEIAPFMIEGMVYGWRFSYTPYDKARRVSELFEFEPVQTLTDEDRARIAYAKPWAENSRLNAWVEFARSESQISLYRSWRAIANPKIRGVGYAKLSEGFDGIQKAAEEALKEAVRSYERTKIKTKPKEISGTVLMMSPPQIGIASGRYRVALEFFMETDRIVEYKTF